MFIGWVYSLYLIYDSDGVEKKTQMIQFVN